MPATVPTKKPADSLPYNAMQTDKLKDTVKTNVTAIIQEKTKQASDFWQSSYAKKAINKTVQAVKNAEVITKVKNTVNPANIKAAAAKTYEDMVKAPIAKTQAAMEEMGEKVASLFGWNNGQVLEGATGNAGWRIEVENVDAKPDSTFQQIVMDRDGEREQTKGAVKSKGVNETNLRNIDDFINGNKKFDEVIEDYAKVYKEHVDLNKPWSWDDTIPGGDSLSSAQKRKIKEMAIEKGHITEIKVAKADGMRYGFADFASAGVVEETVQLPERFWKLSDKEQFKWLDEQIGGTRKGMTWHHTEVPGKMELVPFGIHNITPHNGGRTKGMWADAPR